MPETLRDDDSQPDEQIQKKLFHIADQITEGAERMAELVLRACATADRHWDRAGAAWQERMLHAHELCQKHEELVAREAQSWAQEEQDRARALEAEEEIWNARVSERQQALAREDAAWKNKQSRRAADAAALATEGRRLKEGLQDAMRWRAERSPLAEEVRAQLLSAMGVQTPEQLLALLAQYRRNLESLA